MIKSYVGVTDFDWFQLLREEDGIEEINFWQPGGKRQFKTLAAGDLFLFKLKSPRNFIVGGGTFAHSTLVPISLAWSAFGRKNGVRSLAEMRARTLSLRHAKTDSREDFT
ncbi:MAG: HNH endonuclease, partial [Myxococcota bacterium]